MDDLEENGDFGVSWRLLSAELHKRVRCLATDGDLSTVRLSPYFDTRYIFELAFQLHRFEVNQHPITEVIPVLLKSGQSASREEAVEEMKDCRSTVHPWCRSTVIPEYRPSLFRYQFKPRSHHKLPEFSTVTPIETRQETVRVRPERGRLAIGRVGCGASNSPSGGLDVAYPIFLMAARTTLVWLLRCFGIICSRD
ncbi:hypothetical protein F2Q68_00039238 [Brassica cretica]|uniref:Uncharacterized protein n=1 Tax=Brassica cretica TaxID=69181 RepID=A0A8S9MI91_BRACR|nr:hypothetical protein F2Q68_00039238 [Brassica cretica]